MRPYSLGATTCPFSTKSPPFYSIFCRIFLPPSSTAPRSGPSYCPMVSWCAADATLSYSVYFLIGFSSYLFYSPVCLHLTENHPLRLPAWLPLALTSSCTSSVKFWLYWLSQTLLWPPDYSFLSKPPLTRNSAQETILLPSGSSLILPLVHASIGRCFNGFMHSFNLTRWVYALQSFFDQ